MSEDWTLNTPCTFRAAALSDSGSSRSPGTSCAPRLASVRAACAAGSRTSARTCQPSSSSARATAPPWFPVAPETNTVLFTIIVTSLCTDRLGAARASGRGQLSGHDRGEGQPEADDLHRSEQLAEERGARDRGHQG